MRSESRLPALQGTPLRAEGLYGARCTPTRGGTDELAGPRLRVLRRARCRRPLPDLPGCPPRAVPGAAAARAGGTPGGRCARARAAGARSPGLSWPPRTASRLLSAAGDRTAAYAAARLRRRRSTRPPPPQRSSTHREPSSRHFPRGTTSSNRPYQGKRGHGHGGSGAVRRGRTCVGPYAGTGAQLAGRTAGRRLGA